jgi:hypothetical protein
MEAACRGAGALPFAGKEEPCAALPCRKSCPPAFTCSARLPSRWPAGQVPTWNMLATGPPVVQPLLRAALQAPVGAGSGWGWQHGSLQLLEHFTGSRSWC